MLILGGNPETAALVKVANEMGVFTVVTDSNPDSPAKKVARMSHNIDGLDVTGLIELANRENVDGVLVGVADILVDSYSRVCSALGFPCYATQEIIRVLTQKDTLKEKCREFGIQGIPEYYLDADMKRQDIDKIKYPVVVKPVDNGGGVGISICRQESDLRACVEKALSFSRRKRFQVERYMQCDEITCYYTFQDGRFYLTTITDGYTTKEQGDLSPVHLGNSYPSKHIDLYLDTLHDKMCAMFSSIGILNGVLLISAFVEEGNIYVYDPGFRLQGEGSHLIANAVNGFDHRKMLVQFALTGSMGDMDLGAMNDPRLRGHHALSLWVLLRAGVIGKIDGLEEIRNNPYVVSIVQRLFEGDVVTESMVGNEKQVLLRFYTVCETKEKLKTVAKDMIRNIRVTDASGQNMMLKMLDVDRIWGNAP